MPSNVTSAFTTIWNKEVHATYAQRKAKLRQAVRTHTGVRGSTEKFHVLGPVVANSKTRGADLTFLNPAQSTVTATLVDKYAPIIFNELDLQKTGDADFRREYVELTAQSIARAEDQVIVDALDAVTPTSTVAATSGLTHAIVNGALKTLNENDVDPGDRFLIISPAALEDALNDTKFTSGDYMKTLQGVMAGEISYAMGFTWIVSTRLTATAGVRGCYAMAKSSVGLAIGQDIKTRVDYSPDKAEYVINSCMSMGAIGIDPLGVVKINVTE